MCDCKVAWRTDPASKTSHNQVGVRCSEYIAQLEAGLASVPFGAEMLESIRLNLGIKTKKDPPEVHL